MRVVDAVTKIPALLMAQPQAIRNEQQMPCFRIRRNLCWLAAESAAYLSVIESKRSIGFATRSAPMLDGLVKLIIIHTAGGAQLTRSETEKKTETIRPFAILHARLSRGYRGHGRGRLIQRLHIE